MNREVNVLLVEDNPDDAELILLELKRTNGFTILHKRVDTEDALKHAFRDEEWDAIICDYSLPSFDAARVLELLEGHNLNTPFILVSGKLTHEQASKVLGRRSVYAFVPKDGLGTLGAVFHRAILIAADYDNMLKSYASVIGLRDYETLGHSERVTDLTIQLAETMGIGKADIIHIRRGALVHDLGKLAVRDSVLLKDGPLNDEEMYQMRQHPKRAYDLLKDIVYLKRSLDIPYCHHERWDGKGYPRGLKGLEIPLHARIFSVADNYDAMTSDRPYRPAMPVAAVLDYISDQSGTLFDPEIVTVFLKMMKRGSDGN